MDSELKIIVAFLFKKSGKERLSYSDLYLTLSMDLNWFAPDEAKSIIDRALEQKILTKKDELIKPNFNIDEIVVPVGFHPTMKISEKKERKTQKKHDVLSILIKQLVEQANLEEEDLIKKIKAVADEKNVTQEVAALLVCKEYTVFFDDFFDEIEKSLFTENKG